MSFEVMSRTRALAWTVTFGVMGVGFVGCDDRSEGDSGRLTAPPVVELEGADPAVIEAVRSARAQVAASPRSAASWGNLGMVLLAHDAFEEAAVSFVEAARYGPDDPRWPYLRGLALLEGNPDPKAALPALTRAAELSGDEPAPRLKLAEVLAEQGRVGEAERQFHRVVEVAPENARAHLGLGRLAYHRGDLESAKEHLTLSARKAPKVKATHALLAELHFREGDREGAEMERQRMAQLPDTYHWPDPYFRQVLQRWVGALARVERASDLFTRGRRDEAIKILDETVRLHPDALLAHLALGRFLLQTGGLVEAERALERAVTLAPDAFEAHYELGTALERQGRAAEAANCFEKTLAIHPGYAPAHFHLGRCRLQQGDPEGALESLTATVRFRPDYAEAQRALGHLLAQSGRYAEAAVHLRYAVRLRPSDQKARLLLDEVLRQVE